MSKVVLDTYAWIEYFRGTEQGEEVREYIEEDYELLLPSIVVAELHDKYTRNSMEGRWDNRKNFLKLQAETQKLNFETAEKGAELKWELRKEYDDVGLADAVILAHAVQSGAKLVTGDKHLTHRDEVEDISH
ncbi:MAG: PIN domain-containing protein [Candidatus Nanohalobium sp.]